jgi:hypothetical protein
MHRATPLGHDQTAPVNDRESHLNPAPDKKADSDEQSQAAQPLTVIRGGAPAERRRRSGEHRRRETPVRAMIQPSDPERLRRALEAMREMNKLTRQRTEELRKLSQVSRELSDQMTAFGSAIGGLKIRPDRKSGAN